MNSPKLTRAPPSAAASSEALLAYSEALPAGSEALLAGSEVLSAVSMAKNAENSSVWWYHRSLSLTGPLPPY